MPLQNCGIACLIQYVYVRSRPRLRLDSPKCKGDGSLGGMRSVGILRSFSAETVALV